LFDILPTVNVSFLEACYFSLLTKIPNKASATIAKKSLNIGLIANFFFSYLTIFRFAIKELVYFLCA